LIHNHHNHNHNRICTQRRNANATGALSGTGDYLGLILKVRLNKNVLSKILKTLTLKQSLTSTGKMLKTDGAANENKIK
jgi:uridylate kinase